MFKKLSTILAAISLIMALAGNALADFGDINLVRVVLQQTGGNTEIATNLGTLSTVLAGGTFGGSANAFTAQTGGGDFANLYVTYFAVNHTTRELWISGLNPSISAGKSVTISAMTTSIFNYYNQVLGGGPTVLADASNSNAYRVAADATNQFGQFGTAIVVSARPYTETSLAPLASGSSVTQNLYYFSNYATASKGVAVASLTTNSDGSTTVGAPLDLAPPQVTVTPLPATSSSATVSVSFMATDTTGVSAYQLNESSIPPAAGNANWIAIAPPSTNFTSPAINFTFSGPFTSGVAKSSTVYVWAMDAAGNVSAVKSSSTDVTITDGDTIPPVATIATPLPFTSATININFTLTDTVGVAGYLLNESATPPVSGDPGWVAITPAVTSFSGNANYTFGVGSGASSTKTLYVWAKDAANNVSNPDPTANVQVTILKPAKITGLAPPQDPYFILLQDAFNAVSDNDTILAMNNTFTETILDLNRPNVGVTLQGGYDSGYLSNVAGVTTLHGQLLISSGKLIVDKLLIY